MQTSQSFTMQELLAWYADAGVDTALVDEPIDRFAETQKQHNKPVQKKSKDTDVVTVNSKQPGPRSTPSKTQQTGDTANAPRDHQKHALPDSNAVERAQALASAANTLEELKTAIAGFDGCNLKFTARSTVFADGNPKARLMLIGEAPGRDEDEMGLPFVGRSGQLLDKMLAAIGMDRTQVYISNAIPWRPPGNRAPTPAETDICRPFIERHVELSGAEVLMLIGGSSAKTVLQTKDGIMSLRGKWTDMTIGDRSFAVMPTLHPAYLLRTPTHKRLAWQDLLAVKNKLETPNSDKQ